ncbi:MAG: group 1 glycosyl transferase [Methylotenera sp.]|nr:MAG: group 1 glycosyl transferase [Methylotenera sp.]
MIAIVYPQFYGVGGIARYLDSFLSNLPKNSPKIYVITGDENRAQRRYVNVEIIHIPFTISRFNLFIWGWKARQIIMRLFAEGKIKVINLHFPPMIPGLLLPKHIPIFLTVHSTYLGMSGKFYPEKYYTSEIGWLPLNIKMWMESRLYKNCKCAITLTEFGRQQMLTYGFDKLITIIPNGVDLNQFKATNESAKDIDVIFSGRIELLKGSKKMVEVCKHLIANKPNILIYLVGYGDEESWVREQLEQYSKNIVMTGKVPFCDMMAYYNRSKLYVSTSYYEGLPGTCLEATAMGLPTIAWDFLFYHGLVLPDKTGYLIVPNDSTAMAQKIVAVLDDEQTHARLAANTRAHVEAHYNWADLSQQILQVFKH